MESYLQLLAFCLLLTFSSFLFIFCIVVDCGGVFVVVVVVSVVVTCGGHC